MVLLQWLSLKLGTMHILNNYFILGAILMGLVLLLPRGLLPSLRMLAERLWQMGKQKMEDNAASRKATSDV